MPGCATMAQRRPMAIQVKLLDHTQDPIKSLYLAYRTAYSSLTPMQIERRIEDGRITREEMVEFIERRLQTGHASPLEQVWFEFGISGVSRAFSHQFVRHRIGISFQELLHICDLRLCTRAQWEFRKVASLMRAEVNRRFPELGKYLQPKCGERRWGYCDEDYEAWEACPIGRKRPHKRDLFQLFDSYRKGELIQ